MFKNTLVTYTQHGRVGKKRSFLPALFAFPCCLFILISGKLPVHLHIPAGVPANQGFALTGKFRYEKCCDMFSILSMMQPCRLCREFHWYCVVIAFYFLIQCLSNYNHMHTMKENL